MSVSADYAELGELIFLCLSGAADREQMDRLEARLADDADARRYYGEFLVIYAGLRQSPASLLDSIPTGEILATEDQRDLPIPGSLGAVIRDIRRRPPSEESEAIDGDLTPNRCSSPEAAHEIETYARRQLEAFLAEQRRQERLERYERFDWDFREAVLSTVHAIGRFAGVAVRAAKAGLVLATIALVGLIVGLHIHANRVVATLSDSAEAQWESVPAEAQLRCGWMRLEQGYAQITFAKGAQVILEAPCEFELCSPNAMFLERGRVTARVPKRATGFTISTPASKVVDFGTEFGVLTEGGRGDEVHVFDGHVRFKSTRRRRSTRWDQPLAKGQAATVDRAGQVHVEPLKDRPVEFVRALAEVRRSGKPAGQLDLADIIGGGNGWGRGTPGRGINPSTGDVTSVYGASMGTNQGFIAVPSLRFVDGVFIPDGGEGPVTIDTSGGLFAGFPDTKGTCYRRVMNGAVFRAVPFEAHPGRLAGQVYGTKEHPSIGMHANSGVTFDLQAIRRAHPDVNIVAFNALCGVSETVRDFARGEIGTNAMVEFWVVIDGRLRFSVATNPLASEARKIDLALGPDDRFLTLATTAPGACTFCWGMFAEPVLELETK